MTRATLGLLRLSISGISAWAQPRNRSTLIYPPQPAKASSSYGHGDKPGPRTDDIGHYFFNRGYQRSDRLAKRDNFSDRLSMATGVDWRWSNDRRLDDAQSGNRLFGSLVFEFNPRSVRDEHIPHRLMQSRHFVIFHFFTQLGTTQAHFRAIPQQLVGL